VFTLQSSAAQNPVVDVDADLLAHALAEQLAGMVPDGFHVQAADGMMWYSADEGRFPGQLSELSHWPVRHIHPEQPRGASEHGCGPRGGHGCASA
jgi:hypothetical protein